MGASAGSTARQAAECLGTGYRGQIGIFEVLRVTDEMREWILRGAGRSEVREAAIRDGMQTLSQSALAAIAAGLTTPEEYLKSVRR